jgi:DNA mismatch repair protein MutS
MVETATILHQATVRSFVILDEIGRGTSTYDGLAIAFAVLKTLLFKNRSRSLFATHYHELISLAQDFDGINFLTMKIQKWQEKIIFLHEVIDGFAKESYGLYVAALSGFPKEVLDCAQEVLINLEQSKEKPQEKDAQKIFMIPDIKLESQINMEEKNANSNALFDLLKEIKSIDMNQMTPLKAFLFLSTWQQKLYDQAA